MGKKQLPDEDILRTWFNSGMTYQAMADRWEAETGVKATRAAFNTACRRAGFANRQLSHAGGDLIPWRNIRPEHSATYEHCMLMRVSARRQGKQFDADMDQKINAWLQRLRDDDAVIAYRPDTLEGWWYVKREHRDKDIVRVPDEIVKARKRAARKRSEPAA